MTTKRLNPVSGILLLVIVAGAAHAGDSTSLFLSRAPQTLALALGSGDGTFHRLRTDCSTMAGNGASAVYYDTVTFLNATNVAVNLDLRTQPPGGDGTATCDTTSDTTMMAYSGSFNPAAPMQNCIAYNDDAASPSLDRCSRISGLNVPASGSVVVVVAAYANGDKFAYDLRFDGTSFADGRIFADGFGDTVPSFPPNSVYAAHAASGQIVVDGVVAALPADSWVDAILNDEGHFAGAAQLAPITLSGSTDFGLVTTRLQWVDLNNGYGTVPVNAAGALTFSGMELRLQSLSLNGSPFDIGGECRFSPVPWDLVGSSTATTIDLSDSQFTIPQTGDACGGYQAQLNSLFSGSSNSVDWHLAR